jgi:hypothetical protein
LETDRPSVGKNEMKTYTTLIFSAIASVGLLSAQTVRPSSPGAGGGAVATHPTLSYTPPTQAERFQTYLRHTYGIASILEAGVRAGIDQGLHRPSQWQEGAKGYAERFGSSMGLHAVRGTTTYAVGALLHEDLRYVRCTSGCSAGGKFKAAFENTFAARKGSDGHEAFSFARLIGPVSGGLVASTWRPDGFRRGQVVREIGFTYGLHLMRNLVWELVRR